MEITESRLNGVTVLALTGRLDGLHAGEVEQRISETLANNCERLVLDCSGIEYASSSGLRVLLVTAKRLKAMSGRCAFAALSPTLREIFSVSGFLDVMEIHDTVARAVA